MKPLFFPFTYLRKQDAEILLACFNSFSFLSTSYKKEFAIDSPDLFNDSRIDPVFVEDDELQPVLETLKEYKNWAMLNEGNLDSLKTLFRRTPYFTSTTDVTNIRTEIWKGSTENFNSKENDSYDRKTIFLNSLLFLRLAHENDAEKDAIELEFQSVSAEERQLFVNVRGEIEENISDNGHEADLISASDPLKKSKDPLKKSKILTKHGAKDAKSESTLACGALHIKTMADKNYDPGFLMTEKRLCSWVDILIEKKKHFDLNTPLVLVTTSRGVADYLDSAIENGENLSEIEKPAFIENYKLYYENCNLNAACRDNLSEIFKNVISGGKIIKNDINSIDNGDCFAADISFYRFKGADIKKIFCPVKMQNSTEMKYLNNEDLKNFFNYIFICFIDLKD